MEINGNYDINYNTAMIQTKYFLDSFSNFKNICGLVICELFFMLSNRFNSFLVYATLYFKLTTFMR